MTKAGDGEYVVLFITTGTEEEARRISLVLLEQRKAACVNIIPRVGSLYRWKGRIESTDESLMVVKTRASLAEEVIGLAKGAHSYEIPEIIALPIVAGNPDYLKWLGEETVKEG